MSRAGGDQEYLAERPRLLGLAYRILGSRSDAEDVVQEAWLRWAATDHGTIDRPAAWLTTVTARLALDQLKSARRRREHYVGPWLPEPVVTEGGPEEAAELADSLALGFLAVLEELEPVARVVWLLTEVFAYPSAEVAEVVGRSPAACRQIASRARRRLRRPAGRRPTPEEQSVVDRLLAAVAVGDVAAATALLDDRVVLVTDGGPGRHAARRPVVGPARVVRLLCNVAKRYVPGTAVEPAFLNAAPGHLVRLPSGVPDAAIVADVDGGRITAIWVVNNPDKLARLDEPAGLS